MTLRKQDYKSEEAVAGFLDKYFYPRYFTKIERLKSTENQFNGIDVKGVYLGKELLIDEKTAAHYVNKNIPTFAFELDFIARDGNLHQGWFYDDAKHTQYYLLSWIWAKKEKGFLVEDITKLEIILVERNAIKDLLDRSGLTKDVAKSISSNLRSTQSYGVSSKQAGKPFYFYFTEHLSEKPINVVIHKRHLINISTIHKIIMPT